VNKRPYVICLGFHSNKNHKIIKTLLSCLLLTSCVVYADSVKKVDNNHKIIPQHHAFGSDDSFVKDKGDNDKEIRTETHSSKKKAKKNSNSTSNFTSNAFGFGNMAIVDQRTGILNFSMPFGKATGNITGPSFALRLNYSQLGSYRVSSINKNFSFNLSHAYNDGPQRTMTFSSGQSVLLDNVQSAGQTFKFKYHKLNDVKIVAATDGKYPGEAFFKDGHTEFFDSNGYETKYCKEDGHCLVFNYDSTGQKGRHLASIKDGNDKNLYSITDYGSTKIKVRSPSGTFIINKSNGQVSSIDLPVSGAIGISYTYGQGYSSLINKISYPNGLLQKYIIDYIDYPTLRGNPPSKVPVISEQVIYPNYSTNSVGVSTTFHYHGDGTDSNNYLGNHAVGAFDIYGDSLYKVGSNYVYITKSISNGIIEVNKYNKFHLLISSIKTRSRDDVMLAASYFCYGRSTKVGYCNGILSALTPSGDPSESGFNGGDTYTLASKITKESYDSNGSRQETITRLEFDSSGNLTKETRPDGSSKETKYTADSNGFYRYVQYVKSYPNQAGGTSQIQYYDYKNIGVGNGISVKKISDIKYGYDGGNYWKTIGYDYYGNNDGFKSGLVKSSTYTTTSGSIIHYTNSYDYTNSNNQLIKTVTNPYGLKVSQTQNILSGVITGTTNADKTTQKNIYDSLGRLTSSIVYSSTQEEHLNVTKKYYYAGNCPVTHENLHNCNIVTKNGFDKAQLYDGLNRETSIYVKEESNKWLKVSSTTYDPITGFIVAKIAYGFNNNTNKYTAKTIYKYDDIGRVIESTSPDNVKNETIYIYPTKNTGRVVSFIATNLNSTSAISVVDTNISGATIASYVLSVVKGDYPSNSDVQSKLTVMLRLLNQNLSSGPAAKTKVLRKAIIDFVAAALPDAYLHKLISMDGFNRALSVKDQNGNTSSVSYANQGWVQSKKLPDSTSITYTYEPILGAIKSISYNDTLLGSINYNADGTVESKTGVKDSYRVSYVYNSDGKVTSQSMPNGDRICSYYDTFGRPNISVILKSTSTCPENGFDALKNVPEDLKKYAVTSSQYNSSSGLLSKIQYDLTSPKYEQFDYFNDNNIKKAGFSQGDAAGEKDIQYHDGIGVMPDVEDALSNWNEYTYNSTGQLKSSTNTESGFGTISYSYDRFGRLYSANYPNGIMAIYSYDQYQRLIKVQYSKSQATVYTIEITYNAKKDGAVTNDNNVYQRVITEPSKGNATETFHYDSLNRLIKYECTGALCPKDQSGTVIKLAVYSYGALNNIASIKINESKTNKYTYDSLDPTKLTSITGDKSYEFVYDASGNVTSDGHRIFTYTPLSQIETAIVGGKKASYEYSPGGTLSSESVNSAKNYYFYSKGQLINEDDPGVHSSSYFLAPQNIGKNIDGGKTVFYYLVNNTGSVMALTNGSGSVLKSYAYTPFGFQSEVTNLNLKSDIITDNHIGYNGERLDPFTKMQFLGNGVRTYDPEIRRFLQRDSASPFGEGGVNPYTYVNNSPIMLTDPSGQHGVLGAIINGLFAIKDVAEIIGSFGGLTEEVIAEIPVDIAISGAVDAGEAAAAKLSTTAAVNTAEHSTESMVGERVTGSTAKISDEAELDAASTSDRSAGECKGGNCAGPSACFTKGTKVLVLRKHYKPYSKVELKNCKEKHICHHHKKKKYKHVDIDKLKLGTMVATGRDQWKNESRLKPESKLL
jgi:RHS repeat-associated protein